MPASAPNVCDLLIVQSAAEPIVLAKLLQALRPPCVLHLATPDGKRKGNDDGVLDLYRRDGVVRAVTRCALPSLSDVANGASVSALVEAQLRAALAHCPSPARVVFDTTRGLGLHRMLAQAAVQAVVAAEGHALSAVYADPDKVQLVVVPLLPLGPPTVVPIRFPLDDNALQRRFGLAGLTIEATCPDPVQRTSLVALHDLLCRNGRVRALLHSGMNLRKAWFLRHHARADVPAGAAWQTVLDAIQVFSDCLARDLDGVAPTSLTLAELGVRSLATVHGGDTSNVQWSDLYFADPGLAKLGKALQGLDTRVLDTLHPRAAVGAGDKQKFDAAPKVVAEARRRLQRQIQQGLQSLFADDRIPAVDFVLPPDLRSACQQQLWSDAGIAAGSPIADLFGTDKPANLFEHYVAAVLEAETGRQRRTIRVWQNVSVSAKQETVGEFDAVALTESGDLTAVEVKTHYATATHKDIEARIKTLRDHGGARSDFWLVVPLLADEIAGLAKQRPATLQALTAQGMADVAKWSDYVSRVARTRDQKLIGLDQLPSVIDALARRAA